MSVSIFIFIIIASSISISHSRSLNSPHHLIPALPSYVIADNNDFTSSPFNDDQDQLLHTIEHIIKYTSTIKSSEDFIDDIMNHEKHLSDKLKILKFLKNCFQITDTLIRRENNRLSNVPITNRNSVFTIPFTSKELHEAHKKIHNLLRVIEQQMNILQTWIPPTMPFLNV